MAEEEGNEVASTPERFELGENFGLVGPGLGCLHEAWRVGSGRPALVLIPGADVEWQPEGPWRVCLSYAPGKDSVVSEVMRAPASAALSELANLLVLATAMVERVEEHPRVQAHLARGASSAWGPWSTRARQAMVSVAVFVLGVGLGLWCARRPVLLTETTPEMDSGALAAARAPYVVASNGVGAISYPMPKKPFVNQEPTPCLAKRGEVGINGGCWIEVAQRPPCLEDTHAEYQGRCYLPVAKRETLPSSLHPSGQ
jgi:hypothetical protein